MSKQKIPSDSTVNWSWSSTDDMRNRAAARTSHAAYHHTKEWSPTHTLLFCIV